jgi:hypothetical protein
MVIKKDKKINTEKSLLVKNVGNITDIQPFADNYVNSFVYKKTEKLASAVYMVTNFVSEAEPLRIRLREKSLQLLTDTMSLLIRHSVSDTKALKKYISVESITSEIVEIITLLEISRASGHLSEMNFSILYKEYILLGNVLKANEAEIYAGKSEISPNFFDLPFPKPSASKMQKQTNASTFMSRTGISAKDSLKGHNMQIYEKDMFKKSHARTMFSNKSRRNSMNSMNIRHSSRKNVILELLKRKSELTVKDVAEVITDRSEKTLQRELLALVSQNVLKKKGERRWSTYSLA